MALEYMINNSPVGKLKLVAHDTRPIAILWDNAQELREAGRDATGRRQSGAARR